LIQISEGFQIQLYKSKQEKDETCVAKKQK